MQQTDLGSQEVLGERAGQGHTQRELPGCTDQAGTKRPRFLPTSLHSRRWSAPSGKEGEKVWGLREGWARTAPQGGDRRPAPKPRLLQRLWRTLRGWQGCKSSRWSWSGRNGPPAEPADAHSVAEDKSSRSKGWPDYFCRRPHTFNLNLRISCWTSFHCGYTGSCHRASAPLPFALAAISSQNLGDPVNGISVCYHFFYLSAKVNLGPELRYIQGVELRGRESECKIKSIFVL